MAEENHDRLDIDWVRTTAGALAAVSSAVLLSTLGAAGTLIGAALGSVAATVTTALYSQGLARSRQKVAAVHQQALQKVGIAQAEVHRAAQDPHGSVALDDAGERLAEARAELDEVEQVDTRPWGERLRALPWRRIGLYAAGTFAAAVVALSAVEAILGNPVSSYTGGSDKGGGTSISRLAGSDAKGDRSERDRSDRDGSDRDGSDRDGSDRDGSGGSDREGDAPEDQDGTTPSDGTSDAPEEGSGSEPTSTPTPTPIPTPGDGGATPGQTPPTGTPTPTPDPSGEQLGDGRVPSGVPGESGVE